MARASFLPALVLACASRVLGLAVNSSGNYSFHDLSGEVHSFRLQNGSLQWCHKTCYAPKKLRIDFNSSYAGCQYSIAAPEDANPSTTSAKPTVALKVDLGSTLPAHFGPAAVFRDGMVHTVPIAHPRRLEEDGVAAVAIAEPLPGLRQRHLVRQIRHLALQAKVAITGSALEELSLPALFNATEDPGFSFAIPLQSSGPVFLALPGSPNGSEPCVAIVEKVADCQTCAFGRQSCRSSTILQGPDQETLLGYQLPWRPFMLTPLASEEAMANHEHHICLQPANDSGLRMGRISYYRPPQVSFIKNILIIGVRTFINPGWHEEITLQCTNCSAASQVVIKPITYDPRCRSVQQQMLAALAVASRHGEVPPNVDMSEMRNSQMEDVVQHGTLTGINCPIPAKSPCSEYAEGAFALGDLKPSGYDDAHVTYVLESSRRLSGHEKQIFFHHRSAICLYPGGPAKHGWLVGFAVVHMNVLDMQAFIGFVCFFGVALPLICLVTALLHYNKYERCKHHVRQLRLEYQREQLERELAAGEEEAEARPERRSGQATPPATSSQGLVRSVTPVETNYQALSGEPRAAGSQGRSSVGNLTYAAPEAFLRPS